MIPMELENKEINYLVGRRGMDLAARPLKPYDGLVCTFLSDLSVALLAESEAKQYPDVIAFAFWCRKANLEALKTDFDTKHTRLALGSVFHIAPSNVPINFAFSYVFSLLAGNANVVRVSSKVFVQTEIICRAINKLFGNPAYKGIAEMTAFVQYEHDDNITAAFSSCCNARIIWGGDATIRDIRRIPVPTRSVEIAFADRYSICVISADEIIRAGLPEINRLASAFYNDVYLMDQNACSSPHLIVWLGDGDGLKAAQKKFWHEVAKETASKYDLQAVNAVDKYTLLCEKAIDVDGIIGFEKCGNFLYRIQLDKLPGDMDVCRGKYGLFYEYAANDVNSIAGIINTKYQTITYYGVDKVLLADFVVQNHLSGIDRIVPIGSALDIGVIWDGYDIVNTLSRIIDIK